MTEHTNREGLRNKLLRMKFTFQSVSDGQSFEVNGIPSGDTIDSLMALFDQQLNKALEDAKPAIEIAAKVKALDKLILGAGEYHDDPYEYVIRLRDAQQYRSDLSKFDLSQPIFSSKEDGDKKHV